MRRWYWWLVANDGGQRYLLFGSDKDETEARQKGFEMGMNDFEIKKFPTRNLDAASHMLKFGVVKEKQDISQAGKRLRHRCREAGHSKEGKQCQKPK